MGAIAVKRVLHWWKYLLVGFLCQGYGSLLSQNLTAKDYFLTGTAKYKCRACSEAVEDFTKALELRKDYADAFYGRSLAYLCAKNYPAALQDIDRAMRLNPAQVLYREAKARIKLAAGKNLEAIEEYRTALRMDSLCWQAWYGLAQVQNNLDSTLQSRMAYEKAILLNPKFALSYLGVAEMNIKEGQYDDAMDHLAVAAKLAPEYPLLFELSSFAQLKRGNHEAAIQDANTAIKLDPSNKRPYGYRAEAYFAQGEFFKADLDYAVVVADDKHNGMAWFKRGLCNEKVGDQMAAKKYYGKAVKHNVQIKEAYSNRATIWERLGKPKKALPDLNQAIQLDSKDTQLRMRRGYIYLQLDEVQLASDDFVVVVQLMPANADALYGLGLARYQNGNIKDACEAWKQAHALDDPRAAEKLAKFCND